MRLHPDMLKAYYRWHAPVYDITRWTFLFGRRELVTRAAEHHPLRILEVGCGTGHNLAALHHAVPESAVTGCDLSASMLEHARRRMQGARLIEGQFPDTPDIVPGSYDLVLFSYVLSMCGDDAPHILQRAARYLTPHGVIAVVDFHDTPLHWFRRWMACNHTSLSGQLLPQIQTQFVTQHLRIAPAYGGLWRYFQYLGHTHEPMPEATDGSGVRRHDRHAQTSGEESAR